MRKLLVLAAVAAVLSSGVETQAAVRRVRPQVSNGQTPWNRLMDLERRKNAYLRQMIFGR